MYFFMVPPGEVVSTFFSTAPAVPAPCMLASSAKAWNCRSSRRSSSRLRRPSCCRSNCCRRASAPVRQNANYRRRYCAMRARRCWRVRKPLRTKWISSSSSFPGWRARVSPRTNCGSRLMFRHPAQGGDAHRLRANARGQSSKLPGGQPAKPDHETSAPDHHCYSHCPGPQDGVDRRHEHWRRTRQRRARKIVACWFSMSERRRADG